MRLALNLSLIQIGTLLSAGLLATVIMQLVFGYLSDKGFTKLLLIAGLLALAVVDISFAWAGDYVQVLGFYLLLRAAAGVYHPVSFSMIFRKSENRSASMGFQSAFGDGSLAFAMLSTGFLTEIFGWQFPFLLWGLAGFVGVIAFTSLAGLHQGSSATFEAPRESNNERSGMSKRYLVVQFSTLFLQSLFVTFTGFMPLFLNINLKLSPGLSALVVAFWLAIGVTSSFNAGRLVEILGGERRTLRISFALTSLMMIAATVSLFTPKLSLVTLVFLVFSGAPYFLAFPVIYGIVGTTARRNRLGLAYATNLSLSLMAGSVISYVVGYLSSIYSLIAVFPVLVAIALCASLTSFFL